MGLQATQSIESWYAPCLSRLSARLSDFCAMAAAALCLAALPRDALATTYANAATTFNWIVATGHTRLGSNTPPYSFKNLGGCGTTPPVLDDTISDQIPLGFSFTFGDKTFDSVRVMSNGRIQFTSTTIPLDNTTCGYGSPVTQLPFPNAGLNYTMRIYGNDLDPTPAVDATPRGYTTACADGVTAVNNPCFVSFANLGAAPNRSFVVTWQGVPEWASFSNATGSYNVQLILQENGDFVYQYGTDVPGPAANTAQVGWQVSATDYDAPTVGYPVPNTAIRFFVPHPVVEYLMEQASWSGAGSVLDTSGNARHATPVGATLPTLTASGKVCKGASVTGTTGQAISSGMSVPTIIGNTGTIAFWYKSSAALDWNSSSNVDEVLLDATTASGQWFNLVKRGGANAGKLRFVITDSTGTARIAETAANSVASGTWKHIAVTWSFNNYVGGNNDHLRVYLDAATPTQTTFTSTTLTISPTIGTLYIGGTRSSIADTGLGTGSAKGTIDEFRAYNYEATQSSIASIMNLNTGGCLNHYSITNSGAGLSCQLSQVTVASHTAAHAAYTNNTTITLTSSDATGSWVMLTGLGTLTNIGSNTGQATYNFNGESQVQLGYSHSTANNVTLHVTDGSFNEQENMTLVITSCVPGIFNACEYNATRCVPTAGSNAYANLYTKLANTAFLLDFVAVQVNGTIDPTFTGKTVTVNLLANTNPPIINASTNCPTSQIETVSLGSVAFTNGRGPTGGVNVPATAFSAASQRLSAYRDVRVQIVCSAANCGGTARTVCATDALSVRPQSFTVSSSANADNAGLSATATPAVKAGTSFTLSANTATPGYNGTPSIDPTKAAWANAPAGGRAAPGVGTLAGAFTTAATLATGNGASGTAFTYNDVGYFALLAGGVYDNTFTAISNDQANGDCVSGSYSNTGDASGKYGCLIANSSTTNHFGRFIPDHFAVVTPVAFGPGCVAGGFSYMDQPFSTPLSASIEARNSGDIKTQNYSGAGFGKGTVSAKLENNNSGTEIAGARLGGTGTPSWTGGAYPFTASSFSRPAAGTTDGDYDALAIGVLVTDSDNAYLINRDMDVSNTSCTADTAGTSNGTCTAVTLVSTKMRFGRLRLSNAFGSQKSPLPMPVQAHYWSGRSWVLNSADSCTSVPANGFFLSGGISANTSASAVTLTGGTGTVTLTAPVPLGTTGSVDVAANLGAAGNDQSCLGSHGGTPANLPWLRSQNGNCAATYDRDPSARATFGIYSPESRKSIHVREQF